LLIRYGVLKKSCATVRTVVVTPRYRTKLDADDNLGEGVAAYADTHPLVTDGVCRRCATQLCCVHLASFLINFFSIVVLLSSCRVA
jgi:hypothetical protein